LEKEAHHCKIVKISQSSTTNAQISEIGHELET
jgi:hypothetical protein